jgi:hypothetical protein
LLRKLNLESALVPHAESKIIETVCKVARRMEVRRDWTHAKVDDLENTLQNVLRGVSTMSVQDMLATGPWPVDKMTGPKVYPLLEHPPVDRIDELCEECEQDRRYPHSGFPGSLKD